MKNPMIGVCLFATILLGLDLTAQAPLAAPLGQDEQMGKVYTNARFGFSIRYPENWRLGNPIQDGVGVTLHPPIDNSLVAVSGHMNLLEGTSQDRRQTLDEFATAHRRIITELYGKKSITVKWRPDQELSLAGFPAKQLAFTYKDTTQGEVVEHHIFSLGRNEGRGIRIKVPLASEAQLLQMITKMLETYKPGRDQNAVSPLIPKADSPQISPRP